MRNLKHITIVLVCLSMTACLNGQIRKTVYGNKKVVTRERQARDFTGVRVSSGIDVYLRQGNRPKLTVEADENLHEYIITENRNGVLHVYTDVNIRSAERKRVYVTIKDIESVETSSAGDVLGETPIRTKTLRLSASSAGSIKLEVYADRIRAGISSSGDITLSGEANVLEAGLSSAGDLNAFNLTVREADITASSAGDAEITVTEKLTARASSAGDINYRGNPRYIDSHSSSAGGISKR
jgi:hypothetical protein